MRRFGALFLAVSAVLTGSAHAATYYVSQSGNDSVSCAQAQSLSSPRRTIRGGLSCLSRGGDTLFVRAGTYDEVINNGIPSGTSWSSMVRIAAYGGETVWLRPTSLPSHSVVLLEGQGQQYIEFDGINVDATHGQSAISLGGTSPNLPHHIRVKNAEIIGGNNLAAAAGVNIGAHFEEGNPGGYELINLTIHGSASTQLYGIYVAAPNSLVDGCHIYAVGVAGIHIFNGGGDSPDNNVIRNNRIHDIYLGRFFDSAQEQIWGILVTGRNNEIYNNLIYSNTSFAYTPGRRGIYVYGGSGTKIWNNTITGGNVDGIGIYANSPGTEVRNNIAYGNVGSAFVDEGSGTTQSNNLFGVDPSFVNPSANDFRLGNGSRAKDAGVVLATVSTDILGTARPQGAAPDIGAFEYPDGQSSPNSPPSPPTNVRIVSSN